MGSPPQPPTPPSFSPFVTFVTLLAAPPPGRERDGSTADSFPFDDNRDEKQKEGILEIIKSSDSGSEKAARHDETCLAQVADEEEGSEHNLRTLARSVLDFLSVLKGLAQHNLQYRILDSGDFLSVLKGLAQHNLQYGILDSGDFLSVLKGLAQHNLQYGILDFLSVLKGLAQHNLQYGILDFLSVLKGLAQHNLQYRILDSGDFLSVLKGLAQHNLQYGILDSGDFLSVLKGLAQHNLQYGILDSGDFLSVLKGLAQHNLQYGILDSGDFLSVLKGLAQHNLQYGILDSGDFLSVLKGLAQHNLQYGILDSGASMHATGILRLLSPFMPFVTLLAAPPPGRERDGSTADSFPFDDSRDEKQKEGILEIIKSSDSGSEKAARHDETCLAQVADEEEGSEHNLRTLARSVLDFLSVLKGLAQHNLQSTRAPGGSSAAVYHTRDGKDLRIAGAGSFSPIDADAIPFFLPVISCGSPGPQKLDVQLERVIAAFDNRKLIPKHIKENIAAAFPLESSPRLRNRSPPVMAAAAQEAKADFIPRINIGFALEGGRSYSSVVRGVLSRRSTLGSTVDERSLGRADMNSTHAFTYIPFFHSVFCGGSPGPQKLDVELERVIAAFDNRKLIPKHIKENLACAFPKQRVEICPTRWLAPFASSPTHHGGVAESETSLLLGSGASIHAVGDARLLTGIDLFSIDKWAVLPDGTRLRIVGTGTMQMDGFSIPKVHLVDGLKKNLISVSQLDKEGSQLDKEGCSEHNHLDIILDSGASMHATGNLNLLSEFTRARGSSSGAVYHTRDGKDLRIAGVGMIARDKFHLSNVHYVPELGSRFTLASVQLLAGCDYLVMFCGGRCYVKNRNNGSLVGRGRMHDEDSLYHLEYLRIPLVVVDEAN